MLKTRLLKKLLLLSCVVPLCNLVASARTIDHQACNELSRDVKKMVELIKEICTADKKAPYTNRAEVSKSLQKVLGQDSPLYPFPNLSEATYSELVKTLDQALHQDLKNAPHLLHLWSYLVGIPVVGLQHAKHYYKMNHHLLPKATSDDCADVKVAPTIPATCVRTDLAHTDEQPDGIQHRHIKVPSDLYNSALIYRKKYLQDSSTREMDEVQRTAWPLLENDLVPLENFAADQIGSFLKNCILKINNVKKPLYPLGLLKLFQNTAIYLSIEDGDDSDVIVSPCSKDAIRYFGLQDGLFIERKSLGSDKVHQLFGKQLFSRALFKKNPCFKKHPDECQDCLDGVKGIYYPHYSYSLLDKEDKKELQSLREPQNHRTLSDSMDSFIEEFWQYILSKGQKGSYIKGLLKEMDRQQLRTVLSDTSRLSRFLFNPTFRVELSSLVDTQDGQKDTGLTAQKFIELVIEHLSCVEHQTTVGINLANNQLGDRDIRTLAKAFRQNIVPDLEELDLSYNSITGSGVVELRSLLERDKFISLNIGGTKVKKIPRALSGELSRKITW